MWEGPTPPPILVLTQKLLWREGMLRLAQGWGPVGARAVDNPWIQGAQPHHRALLLPQPLEPVLGWCSAQAGVRLCTRACSDRGMASN